MNTYEIILTNTNNTVWFGDSSRRSTDRRIIEFADTLHQAMHDSERATGLTAVSARLITPLPEITEARVREIFDGECGQEPIIDSTFEIALSIEHLIDFMGDILVPGLTCDTDDPVEPWLTLEVYDPVTGLGRATGVELYDLFDAADLDNDGMVRQEALGRDLDVRIAMRIIERVKKLA